MAEKALTEEDLMFLHAFTFKTEENLSDKTFEQLRHTFTELNLELQGYQDLCSISCLIQACTI